MAELPIHPLSSEVFSLCFDIAEDAPGPAALPASDPAVRRFPVTLTSASGLAMKRLVLELPDLAALAGELEGRPPVSMAEVELSWQRRSADRWKLEPASGPPRRMVLPGRGGGVTLPPLVDGQDGTGCFGLPCPVCRGHLETCRDGDILTRHGLGEPMAGGFAALFCPTCYDESSAAFYLALEEVPESLEGRGLRTIKKLQKEYRAARKKEARPPASPSQRLAPEASWRVVTDRSLPFAVMRQGSSNLDPFLSRLGGDLGEESPEDHFLFASGGAGLDAVEILALKLSLFHQVLEAVERFHRLLERPYADLGPSLVTVEPSHGARQLPGLWNFRVFLDSITAARLHRLSPEVAVVTAPAKPRMPYGSMRVRRACLLRPQVGNLTVDRVTPVDDGKVQLEARLSDSNGLVPRPAGGDRIRLRFLGDGVGLGEGDVIVQPDPRAWTATGPLAVVSDPFSLEPDQADRWANLRRVDVGTVEYRLYPHLGFFEDLHSLGMLLMRILVVNDQQDLSSVQEALEGLLEPFDADSGKAASPAANGGSSRQLLGELLERSGTALSAHQIFHRATDRLEGRVNAIPEEVWRQVLGLGLDLLIHGTARGPGDEPGILKPFLVRTRDLLRRLRTILFQVQGVHMEVQSVVAEMAAALERPE